jgi:hypothetical protein
MENLKGRDQSGDLSKDRRIILECILEKRVRKMRIGFFWLKIGTSGGLL